MTLTGDFADQTNPIDQPRKARLERIIYSATIISTDTAFSSMSGAAYTVYIIQVRRANEVSFPNDQMSVFLV